MRVFLHAVVALACVAAARIPVFFDQDSLAGGSNVLSLAMALLHPEIDVVGIGVIAGDSSIDDALYATLQVVEACGKKVPVARGAGDPFLNSRDDVYGRIGLWGPKVKRQSQGASCCADSFVPKRHVFCLTVIRVCNCDSEGAVSCLCIVYRLLIGVSGRSLRFVLFF